MWCTSRASPHSTTRPTWVRVFSRMRWWCTAAVSSSDGMGASSSDELRSESTMILAPSAMASVTLARTSSSARRRPSPPSATAVQPVDGEGLEAGHVAVVVDVEELGQLVVVDDRERAAPSGGTTAGPGRSRLPSGPMVPTQRGDELLADGVERRVGDLREQLLEVVEQQAGAVGQDGDRRVGAHRADRLGAGAGHRRDEDLQLLGACSRTPAGAAPPTRAAA